MSALYELSAEYRFLRDELVDQETGEVNESVLTQLSTISESIDEKGINLVRVMKDMEAEQEAVKRERERLQARERAVNNQIKRLKEYLLSNMEGCQIQKISCPQFDISIRNNPESVDIFDQNGIPSDYHRLSVDYDKTKIKDALRRGIEIPGARLVRTTSLMIR